MAHDQLNAFSNRSKQVAVQNTWQINKTMTTTTILWRWELKKLHSTRFSVDFGDGTSDITNHSFLFCSCLLMLVAHVKWSTCSAKFKGKPYPNPSFPQLLSLEPFSMFLLTVLLFWQNALMLWFTLIHHIMFIHLTSQYICNTVQGVEVRLQACKNTSVL